MSGVTGTQNSVITGKHLHKQPLELEKGVKEYFSQPILANKVLNVDELGKVYTNVGATDQVSIALPNVKTCIGKSVSLVSEADFIFAVSPASGETILGQTADKALYSAAAGATIVLGAASTGWAVKSSHGTWTEEP